MIFDFIFRFALVILPSVVKFRPAPALFQAAILRLSMTSRISLCPARRLYLSRLVSHKRLVGSLSATGSDMTSERFNNNGAVPKDLVLTPTTSLIRGYAVYSALSFPSFVDASPTLLSISTSIPIVKQIALFVVRNTFFRHFVGGETFQETVPLVRSLRERNLACTLEYSVEVDEAVANQGQDNAKPQKYDAIPQYQKNVEEILSSIPLAAGVEGGEESKNPFTRKTWIAIKLSALLPSAQSLRNFSTALLCHQTEPNAPFVMDILYNNGIEAPMTEQDVSSLKDLHASLKKVGELAVKHQVRVLVDAEHTWYQPAIDAFSTDMMMSCNLTTPASPINPPIYLTFQAYLRSTPARLKQALAHASSNGYILGTKLVRGAYHSQEIQQHESNPTNENTTPPVWSEKGETDQCYNQCTEMLLDQLVLPPSSSGSNTSPRIGLLFGTHNKDSCDIVMNGLLKRGLASEEPGKAGILKIPQWVSGQVQLGQLLGMADELTNYVSSRLDCEDAPMVLKYVPYGKLEDVMPYLGRRAIENKSVFGNSNTDVERRRIASELKRRLFRTA